MSTTTATSTTTIPSIPEHQTPQDENEQPFNLNAPPPTILAEIPYYLNTDSITPTSAPRSVHVGTAKERLRPRDLQKMPIRDVRQHPEANLTLDKDSFQYVSHAPIDPTILDDPERIKGEGYEETKELIKKVAGATEVLCISHVVRRQDVQTSLELARKCEPDEMVKVAAPAMFAHVDQSPLGAAQLLSDNLPSHLRSRLLHTCRWAVINIWRPWSRPVTREPLAVCSYTSVNPEKDCLPTQTILPPGKAISQGESFELYNVVHNPGHGWWYMSHMRPDEALFIKCFDSKLTFARCCPHTAFQSPYDEGPARRSFEVRCLVFWEGEEEE